MNRSGFSDECDDPLAEGRWTAAVNSSLRGKRGQAFLRELLAALDAMPDKRLIANSAAKDGCMCTLAVVAAQRGHDLQKLDSDMAMWEWGRIAEQLGISQAMAREVMYLNDKGVSEMGWVPVAGPTDQWGREPEVYTELAGAAERRWQYMRGWVAQQLKQPGSPAI